MHVSLVGVFLIRANVAGIFMTRETGQAILQKARFFLKIKAKGMAVA
jgi:hypothetical protein